MLTILVAPGGARAAAGEEGPWPLVDAAAERGLAFLARQQAADGSFAGGAPPVGQTALTVTAFLARGHTPVAGKYGPVVRAGVDYLLAQATDDGYFGRLDKSRMYGQAAVTLALSLAVGVEADAGRRGRTRAAVERAVGVILKAQVADKEVQGGVGAGGWRVEPSSGESDLVVTSGCLLALRAARDAGLAVPAEAFERGLGFVRRCFHPGRKAFSNQPGKEPSAAMTAAGVICLQLLASAGADADMAAAAGKYLADNRVQEGTPYASYAACFTAHAALLEGGAVWSAVWKATREGALPRQMEDGGWPASRTAEEPGRVYATTMAVLALSTPNRLVPVFEK